jgi:hypothetical protein
VATGERDTVVEDRDAAAGELGQHPDAWLDRVECLTPAARHRIVTVCQPLRNVSGDSNERR